MRRMKAARSLVVIATVIAAQMLLPSTTVASLAPPGPGLTGFWIRSFDLVVTPYSGLPCTARQADRIVWLGVGQSTTISGAKSCNDSARVEYTFGLIGSNVRNPHGTPSMLMLIMTVKLFRRVSGAWQQVAATETWNFPDATAAESYTHTWRGIYQTVSHTHNGRTAVGRVTFDATIYE